MPPSATTRTASIRRGIGELAKDGRVMGMRRNGRSEKPAGKGTRRPFNITITPFLSGMRAIAAP
jgi:hypothetical protein